MRDFVGAIKDIVTHLDGMISLRLHFTEHGKREETKCKSMQKSQIIQIHSNSFDSLLGKGESLVE